MYSKVNCVDFNIFVGGTTGAFKGVKIDKQTIIAKNLQNVEILKPENEITVLNWSDKVQSDVLIGSADQIVKVYDTEFKAYSTSLEAKVGFGPIVGLTRINGSITTCCQSGHIKIWRYKKSEERELEIGLSVSKMQKCNDAEGIVATGGEQNDLKIWNLETKSKIFCAKNVKKDMLELEIPIWISDLAFLPKNEYKVATCTRHGYVRLYDTKAQRRPVVNISVENRALTTLSLCQNENHIIVGSALGHILLVDLRNRGKILHSYSGAVGGIRQVVAHPELPYIASVGLDRFLRIHHLQTKKILHQLYLNVKLNCVLMSSSFGKETKKKEESNEKEEEPECINLESESDEECTETFGNMKNVTEPARKKIKK